MKINVANNTLFRQRKLYNILITLILLAFISGIVLIFFIDKNNKANVLKNVSSFFYKIKLSEGIKYSNSLYNTLISNLGYAILIWILGISIIGLPIILFTLIFKSFVLGFSISSIIAKYGFKGLLGAFLYVFPHQILLLIIYLLLSFYSINFCYRLILHLFLKKSINLRLIMNKYLKILFLSVVSILFISLYEVYLSTYFIKIFTLLIK